MDNRLLSSQHPRMFQHHQLPHPRPPLPSQQQQQPQQQHCQQDTLPDYCRKLTVRDSNGVLKEMIFPKALDLDRPKRARTTFSSDQLIRLEEAFRHNHYMVGRERNDLAKALCLSETQVKVWFQNRRTKFKRDQGSSPSSADAAGRADSPTIGGPAELLKLPAKPPVPVSQAPASTEAAAAAAAAAAYMYGMPWYRHHPASASGVGAAPPFLMPQPPPGQHPEAELQQLQSHPQPQPQPYQQHRQLESAGGGDHSFHFGQSSLDLQSTYHQIPGMFRPRDM